MNEHGAFLTQDAPLVLARAANAHGAAHVGLPTEMRGHVMARRELPNRRKHGMWATGKDAVKPALFKQRQQGIRDATR